MLVQLTLHLVQQVTFLLLRKSLLVSTLASLDVKRLEDRRLHKATFARTVQIHLVIPILILYLCRVQITNVPQAEVMTRR